LGILGGGQMGSGIAAVAAQQGIQVVIKSVSLANAHTAKDYAAAVFAKNKRIDDAKAQQLLDMIQPTDDYAAMADCDAVIEAVFEDRQVKAEVTKACEAALGANAIFASNTSALPISELAEASVRP